MNSLPRPKDFIADVPLYIPGEAHISHARVVALAANENPLGPSQKAIEAYKNALTHLHRYPDGGSLELRKALAHLHAIEPNQIVCGTGSDEIITMICRAYAGAGDEILHSQYGFLMYPIAAKLTEAQVIAVPETNRQTDLQAILDHVTDKTKIIFLANPNNPTGYTISKADLWNFCAQLRSDIILVLDGAYAEYVSEYVGGMEYEQGFDLVQKFPNVVHTRTFSKIYGLAALRVGWSYSSVDVADCLNRVRGVFNINRPAQKACLAALDDQAHLDLSCQMNSRNLRLTETILQQKGFVTYPSHGNFLLFSCETETRASDLLDHFKTKGILARPMKSYALPDTIRLTIGLDDDMSIVFDALETFVR
jgi:histidinol-phosphate aminotransferase